jgi:hypothetical protein
MSVPSRPVAVLIVLILVELVAAQSIHLFPRVIAIDFYQHWGVGAARRLSGPTLGSPYREYKKYNEVLREYVEQTDQSKLMVNFRAKRPPGFTATPFLYMLFAAFPADYSRAVALFQALQVLLFLAAIVLLGAVYHYQTFPLVCLALLLVLGSGPLSSDLRNGNLGCLQVFALAALLVLTDRLRRTPRPAALGALVLAGFTLLALAKPNVALVVAVMAGHVWLVLGTRAFAVAAVAAALSGAAAVIISCVYFRSWTVWQEWYDVVFGRNPYHLVLAPAIGNYSTSRLLAAGVGVGTWTIAIAIAAVLVLSIVAVIAGPVRRAAIARAAPLSRALARSFDDPHLAMAIGITMTIALSPLLWYHYYVIALIPGLWLLNASAEPRYLPLGGLASLVLSSGLLNVLFLPLGWTGAAAVGAALSWIPLWAGILCRLSAAGFAGTGPGSAPPEHADERRAPEARPPRRPRSGETPARG